MEKGEGAKRAMGWKGEIKCGGVMIREREREREKEMLSADKHQTSLRDRLFSSGLTRGIVPIGKQSVTVDR